MIIPGASSGACRAVSYYYIRECCFLARILKGEIGKLLYVRVRHYTQRRNFPRMARMVADQLATHPRLSALASRSLGVGR